MDINYSIKKEALRRGYSARTIRTYCKCVEVFLRQCRKEISQISKGDLRDFLDKMAEKEKAGNTINVYLNALKFFFEQILNKRMKLNIKFSKIPEKLPVVLTKEELKKLFDAVENEKHKLMLQLMYSGGLRVSELINLKIEDLNLAEGYGFVRKGKGSKDRIFIIAEKLKPKLIDSVSNRNGLLFESNRKEKYNIRTLQEIIKKAARKTGMKKNIHPHTLRHSFATHLIENGYALTAVQSLLGHKSPETTMVYVHTANIKRLDVKSPFDEL